MIKEVIMPMARLRRKVLVKEFISPGLRQESVGDRNAVLLNDLFFVLRHTRAHLDLRGRRSSG